MPLVWRRRAPISVFAAVMVVCLVQLAVTGRALFGDASALVALYTLVGYASSRRSRALGVGASLVGAALCGLRWTHPLRLGAAVALSASGVAFLLVAALLGERRRNRQAGVLALRERNRLLAVERDQQATIAAASERARIARELHDIVAHSLSVIVTQADGGRYAAAQDQRAPETALGTIAQTAREARGEMRRLLGVLRVGGDGDGAGQPEPERAPQPGAAQLDQLVDETARTGLPVKLSVTGAMRPLPAGVDVTVYRLVQEALTNVLKHAGSVTAVEVRLRYLDRAVEVAVRDDGRGAAAATDGRGHGLLGMRERVELQGGLLRVGPRAGGGYEAHAQLPAAEMSTGTQR